MKYLLLCIILLLAITAATAYSSSRQKKFQPTERIPADTAVSFPVDI